MHGCNDNTSSVGTSQLNDAKICGLLLLRWLQLVGIATCRAVVVLSDKVDPEQCDSEVLEKLLLIESFVPVRGASTWTVAEVSQRDTARLISASFTRTSSITNGDIGLNLTLRSLLMPGMTKIFIPSNTTPELALRVRLWGPGNCSLRGCTVSSGVTTWTHDVYA